MSKIAQIFSSPVVRGFYPDEQPEVPFKMEGSKQEKKRLTALINRIAKSSPFGKSVLEKAAENYTLCFEMQSQTAGYTAPKSKVIALSPEYSDKYLLNVLVHESRHAGQFENGLNCDFGQMTVRSELMQFRAMEADAEACAGVATFEMKQKGDKKPFAKFSETSYDIAKQLQAFDGNPAADTGEMLRAAFDGWYKDGMIKDAYESSYITSIMDRAILDKTEAELPYSKQVKSADVIEKICVCPAGCYFADDKNHLDNPALLDISHGTVKTADRFFEVRKMRTGMEADASYKDLPTRAGFSEMFNTGVYLGKTAPETKKAPLAAAIKAHRIQGR